MVLLLGLTVCLRVQSGRESVMETEVGTNDVPKSTGKLFAAIGGDIGWYMALVDHVLKQHLC